MGIEDITYAKAGVSIRDQNSVNRKIKEMLTAKGMKMDGWFGGIIDVSEFKNLTSFPIRVACGIGDRKKECVSPKEHGRMSAANAVEEIFTGKPLAALDYFASSEMGDEVLEFVEALATDCANRGVPVIGGESAQLRDTFRSGGFDGYVHLIYFGGSDKQMNIAPNIRDMKKPLLVASTDGVGTKTKIIRNPLDVLFHGFNDIAAIGAKPIAYSLYVAGNENMQNLLDILKSAERVRQFYNVTQLNYDVFVKPQYLRGEVDIAATVLGIVDEQDLITGQDIKEGDVIIGFATDCLMTNGYTLARKLALGIGGDWNDENLKGLEGSTINAELSKPHTPYSGLLLGGGASSGEIKIGLRKYLQDNFGSRNIIKAAAHITGGGLVDNIGRILPDGLCTHLITDAFRLPRIIEYFKFHGASMKAMKEAFNMGVGFAVVVAPEYAADVIAYSKIISQFNPTKVQRTAAMIGKVMQRQPKVLY